MADLNKTVFQPETRGVEALGENTVSEMDTRQKTAKTRKRFPQTKGILWVFVLALVAVTMMLAFNFISDGIDDMLLREKLIEKQLEINLIAEQTDLFVDKDEDWDSAYEHYVDSIITTVELLDRVSMTYAAVFDENLENLSARSPSYEGSPFEPNLSAEYVQAVGEKESGNVVIPFTPPGSEERDMHLYFRWLPSDTALPHRILVVIAISKFTVDMGLASWLQIPAVLLVVAVVIIAIFLWRRQLAKSLNRTLEDTVHQRTLALEEQTENAKKASSAKSDFLSNMSHEMRTPMNAIIGMTAIAQNSDEVEHKDYCLKKIEDASVHLLSVIDDILDMSKIEANKFELSCEKFNFERVLQKVANIIVFRVDEKRQNFTVHIGKEIPQHLIGDDQRIAQVVANLMSNAVKFTPEGGSIRLNASLLEEKDNLCTIKVEVADSGIGISPEQQARLFSSFVQAESNTTRKFGGTGLGLAISKHIVELMGGEIWVESELGKGATFAFTIKAERVAEPSDGLLAMGISWANMSVLVVDDQAETLEYFSEIMTRFGSRCDVAASGEEACRKIESHGPYNLYFIDWKMPGMDGIDLAKRIDATEADKSVIVMVSAGKWDEIKDDAKSAGIRKFLPKPLFPSSIADCINECLGLDNVLRDSSEGNYKGLFKGHHIILADDVEVNREIVISLLEDTELVIDTAENGKIALELFRQNPDVYDMIFMDVQMPEMDGYEATRQIRGLGFEKAREIPIVAMTANVFKEDIEKCLACGMNDHLGKPLNYAQMISKLCRYLFIGNFQGAGMIPIGDLQGEEVQAGDLKIRRKGSPAKVKVT